MQGMTMIGPSRWEPAMQQFGEASYLQSGSKLVYNPI